jgi:hypothetical protein
MALKRPSRSYDEAEARDVFRNVLSGLHCGPRIGRGSIGGDLALLPFEANATQSIVAKIPMAETAQAENTAFSKKVRRVFGLDLHSWEQVMLLSLGAAALAAVAVVVATTIVVKLQKEESSASKHELNLYKVEAGEKIVAAEAVGKTAQADIAKANAQIAEATARTKEAELKLEQLRERMRPRSIKGEEFLQILEGKPKSPVEILFVRDGPDCFQLSMQIRDWLKKAEWQVKEPRAIESGDMTPRLAQYTSAMGLVASRTA